MDRSRALRALLLVSSLLPLTACSSTDGPRPSVDGGTPDRGRGGAVNDGWTVARPSCIGTVTGGTFAAGAFSATVAGGAISRCANATAPTARAESRPPALDLHANDTVVTAGGESYHLDLGANGFRTTEAGAVVLRVPFDVTKVPAEKRDALHVFLRAHLPRDGAVVDLTGTIDGGVVRTELRGLPAALDVAVLYNPGMRAVSVAKPASAAAIKPQVVGRLTPEKWGAHAWCAVFDPTEPTVVSATAAVLGSIGPPSLDDIDTVARTRIADGARTAQTEYEAKGFRQPDLYVGSDAAEPCGGTDPRFFIHWLPIGSKYKGLDPAEVVAPDGDPFGRIYISTGATSWSIAKDGANIQEVIAHELLHGIQAGYSLWGTAMRGYQEGTSTTYGRTIGLGASEAQVRSRHAGETFLLSNFVTVSTMPVDVATYSNQDFFAYVARTRNGGSPGYLTGLYARLHEAVEAAAAAEADPAAQDAIRWEPPRAVLLEAMDASFRAFLGTDLRTEYIGFLRERAFDHGPNGFFSRTNERQAGFARELFVNDPDPAKAALFGDEADPAACTVSNPAMLYAGVAPLAARAVSITPKATTDKAVAIHFKLKGGGAGTRVGGVVQLGKTTQVLADETVVDGFGKTRDPIWLTVANLDLTERRDIGVLVTCEAMTDNSTPLQPFTWSLGESGSFTVEASLTGTGLHVKSEETSLAHVVEAELATKIPAGLKVSLHVTPPPPTEAFGVHSSYTITGYEYQLKQPSLQGKQDTGSSMSFTIDKQTAKELGASLYLFDVDLNVKYRQDGWYTDDEGHVQSSSSNAAFTALSLLVYVNVP